MPSWSKSSHSWRGSCCAAENSAHPRLAWLQLTGQPGRILGFCLWRKVCRWHARCAKRKASHEGECQFVFSLDQGPLSYPWPKVVWMCKLECTFADTALQSVQIRHCGQMCELLSSAVPQHVKNCPLMWCSACRDSCHCEQLCELLIKKMLRPQLANWAGDNSSLENILWLSLKPLSRKVLRLWNLETV